MAATKRRDRGSGSVYREKDGLWVAALTLPPDPVTGKQRRKVMRSKSKQQVMKKLAAAKTELDRAGDLPTASPTVEQWMGTWLEKIAAPRLKPRTLATYRGYVSQYIVPAIGRYRLDRLTPAHVRQMHDRITGQGLSSTTALQAHRILVKALTDAMREGRVSRNVATLVDAPRRATVDRPVLTVDQAVTLLRYVADKPGGARWAFALLTGTRQGESLGLTRDELDLDAGIVTVAWQLQRLTWQHGCEGTCGYKRAGACPQRTVTIPPDQETEQVEGGLWLTRPKSRRSWRRVPMAPALWEIMRRHIDSAEPERLVWGVRDPSDDWQEWRAMLDAAGLPRVPLHSTRHTTSTLLAAMGVPEQTRMEILGHSSATVTRGYTHIDIEQARRAMDGLGELLLPGA